MKREEPSTTDQLLAILFIVFYIHFHQILVDDPQSIKAFILANHCAQYYYDIVVYLTALKITDSDNNVQKESISR